MSLSQCWVSAAGMLTVNLKLDLVCLMPPTHACAERAPSSCLLPVMVLFQDSAVVPGLIDTIDTVMSHISYNLQASKPQVAIVGSSSMAGSLAVWVWVRMAVRQAGAGGRGVQAMPPACCTPAFLCAQRYTQTSHAIRGDAPLHCPTLCCLMCSDILEEDRVRLEHPCSAGMFTQDHGSL